MSDDECSAKDDYINIFASHCHYLLWRILDEDLILEIICTDL